MSTNEKQLENAISKAMAKVGCRKESDLCRYLPMTVGGYMHHFTFRKMKSEKPENLSDLISKHIINADKVSKVAPKQRAPRGSRKGKNSFSLTRQDLERMLNLARMSGDKEMIRRLSPKRDLKTVKRELISSIRHGKVDHELWTAYTECMSLQNFLPSAQNLG